jgi:hypothetical protein
MSGIQVVYMLEVVPDYFFVADSAAFFALAIGALEPVSLYSSSILVEWLQG